jgi:cysteine synthase
MTEGGSLGRPAAAAYRGAMVFDDPFLHAAVGDTPLVRLNRVVPEGCGEVWLKLESGNPTGSYKDRMAVSVIRGALERRGFTG